MLQLSTCSSLCPACSIAWMLETCVQQCMDLVDDESKIIMDILICGSGDAPKEWDRAARTGWYTMYRAHTINSYYVNTNSLARFMIGHPNVQVRHTFQQGPSAFGGLSEINFEGDFTWPAQEAGRTDAQNALASTAGANKTPFYHEWNADEELQKTYKNVGDYVTDRTQQVQSLELAQF